MSVITKMRRQKAIWWQRLKPDNHGQYSFAGPMEIGCRWDGKGAEYRSKTGEISISDAVVYPDRELRVGDKLKEGEIDSNTPNNPLGLMDAFEIQRVDKTPNFKATEFLHTVYL